MKVGWSFYLINSFTASFAYARCTFLPYPEQKLQVRFHGGSNAIVSQGLSKHLRVLFEGFHQSITPSRFPVSTMLPQGARGQMQFSHTTIVLFASEVLRQTTPDGSLWLLRGPSLLPVLAVTLCTHIDVSLDETAILFQSPASGRLLFALPRAQPKLPESGLGSEVKHKSA